MPSPLLRGDEVRKVPDGRPLSVHYVLYGRSQVFSAFIKDHFTERISYASNMRLSVFIRHTLRDPFVSHPSFLSPTYVCCYYYC